MTRPQQLDDPQLFREFPFNIGTRMLGPGDIRATPDQRQAYLRYTRMGDPIADRVVEMIGRLPTGEGRRMFETAVEHSIAAVTDAPLELVAFFESVDAVPYWVDHGKLAHAAHVSARVGAVTTMTAMSMLALMGGYVASRADKTLVGTGDLTAMAPRRLAETATWTFDVIAPGGLERFAPGFKGILRVRLMHALVRAGMNRRPDWDYARWDHPVNQSVTAGTRLLFSLANIVGAQAFGAHFTRREKDAIYQLWRYVGYLMGIHPELLPAGETDTWRLLWLQADYEFLPDEDSQRLAQALAGAIGPSIVGDDTDLAHRLARHLVAGFLCAYSRLILGKTNADFLGLADSKPFQAAVVAFAVTNRLLEYPRRATPGLDGLQARIGHRNLVRLADRMRTLHHGDRSYNRHDRIAETRRRRARAV